MHLIAKSVLCYFVSVYMNFETICYSAKLQLLLLLLPLLLLLLLLLYPCLLFIMLLLLLILTV